MEVETASSAGSAGVATTSPAWPSFSYHAYQPAAKPSMTPDHEPSQRGDGDGSPPSSSTVLCGGYAQTSYDSPSRKKYLKASHLPHNCFRSLVLRSQMAESEIRGLVTESRPSSRHMFALFFLISPGGKEIEIASPEPRIASHRCLAR